MSEYVLLNENKTESTLVNLEDEKSIIAGLRKVMPQQHKHCFITIDEINTTDCHIDFSTDLLYPNDMYSVKIAVVL